ncbi:arginine--tRNA ligase [Candidatus Saccharibacteria bacterium]|nr:arginine--tRNA ligase [Candidatus Saccharibacteria bacterium]
MEEIKKILTEIVGRVFGVKMEVEVSEPPELEQQGEFRADVATNVAMKLAGTLSKQTGKKQNPREVGERLKSEFLAATVGTELEGTCVEMAGPGFLNFMLPDGYFRHGLAKMVEDFEGNISCDEYKNKVVVTEFSDPNPFKVLHIGHLYTSVVGEAISKLIEFAGGEVHRVNFGGDVGLHVAKTMYALRLTEPASSSSADALLTRRMSNTSRSATPASSNKLDSESSREVLLSFSIEDIAQAYVEGTRLYEEDEGARAEIVKLNKQIYELVERDEHEGELAEMYWKGRELSYRYFDEFYARIGVKFEKYYPESTVAGRGLETVKAHVPEVYQESDGAVVFKGEEYGLHTRVFVNKEGLPTYEAKDVGLLFAKDEDYKFDESVVITGNDIVDYMKVVLKSVEQYAPELVAKTRHITHGNVRLPGNEKMSSRKGNFVKAVDVLEQAPLDAIKYSFLKYKIGGNIEFDAEESVSLTGNSGLYLQYSAVRAGRIMDKLGSFSGAITANDSLSGPRSSRPSSRGSAAYPSGFALAASQGAGRQQPPDVPTKEHSPRQPENELLLTKKILAYAGVLTEAVREMAPHLICNYLFELAQEFSRFYENCPVAGSEREAERGKMVQVFYKIMEHGLGLLGISVPEEM